jgi:prevent-host-death family protein
MTTITLTDARSSLPALLDRVARGEEVTITRHGRSAAVLIRPDTLRSRRADAALAVANEVRELLEAAKNAPLTTEEALDEEYADALVAEVRAGRDRR